MRYFLQYHLNSRAKEMMDGLIEGMDEEDVVFLGLGPQARREARSSDNLPRFRTKDRRRAGIRQRIMKRHSFQPRGHRNIVAKDYGAPAGSRTASSLDEVTGGEPPIYPHLIESEPVSPFSGIGIFLASRKR
jgi:hypothetical protein